MEQENTNRITGPSEGAKETGEAGEPDKHPVPSWPPQPTVLTLQDLLDIPRQILPEETYFHLKNAGREAVLAVLSLANSINNSRRETGSGKTRKHINVE